METNDEVVERQKLVPNDLEGEEEINNPSNISQAVKSATNLTSPAVPKMIIKNMSSGETTHSRNSASCSIERTSEKGQLTSAKVTYINERRSRPNLNGNISAGGCSSDDRIAFKSQRKTLKAEKYNSDHSTNNITQISSELCCSNNAFIMENKIIARETNNINDNKIRMRLLREKENSNDSSALFNTINGYSGANHDNFDNRPIKHHSFVSEVPDVKHMERALLGLLDDFHSGKLKAFGSGCTMEQMSKIREQQESLAKLHFELAATEEDSLDRVNDFNSIKAQENMLQLVQRLEQLSISIEQLQSSHIGL
ncbi:uncharacterized protein LOC101458926 isoform X2 [Ceratitis capitata]|uniref:uncharacterized protein LOC101458926 isoform X2 n=1 Tax=Ceratitis capitata TaxID=7213 RepID=UPI0006188A9F|nr:uncharacterized protein LOC101458926 isoform X2 [Ceratitis capitata]